MYIGMTGVIHAVRKPANILAVQPGAISKRMYDDRLLAMANITIGRRVIENALILFDTGATESIVFLPDAVNETGLTPHKTGIVRTADGTLKDVLYYESTIEFESGVKITTDLIDVMEMQVCFADMIVGMDIISKGRLTVDGKTKTFSFEI